MCEKYRLSVYLSVKYLFTYAWAWDMIIHSGLWNKIQIWRHTTNFELASGRTWSANKELSYFSEEEKRRIYRSFFIQGRARTQSPTTRNCAPESPTFGAIARVNPTGVQWKGLALGEQPFGSLLTPVPGKYAWNQFKEFPDSKKVLNNQGELTNFRTTVILI